MNGTPRLRSAFPTSPTPIRPSRRTNHPAAVSTGSNRSAKLETPRLQDTTASPPSTSDSRPVIPFETIDAPSQRLYAVAAYLALVLWRLYDFYNLTIDETESLWLFMKWVSLDGVFLFGLPSLHIPWLEWSSSTMTALFFLHATVNGILMFRIPIPFGAWIVAFARMVRDREIAVDERSVKPADILNNPQLILGRQIINILPEGSAVLNPEKYPLCISAEAKNSAILPIQINQTAPTSIQLIRFDFDTSNSDIISIGSWEAKSLLKRAQHRQGKDSKAPLVLEYAVKKPGLYRLGKVVDATNLEVQHASSEAFVVKCPTATMKHAQEVRCRGEMSNIGINVEGTAPLKVKYRKSFNEDVRDIAFQSIQPDDFNSPLMRQKAAGPAVLYGDNDLTWARSQSIFVPLNETLFQSGQWSYSIDEVADAFGNVVSYSSDSDEFERPRAKLAKLEDSFIVLERPRAALSPRKPAQPIRAARGDAVTVPISILHQDVHEPRDQEYVLSYDFTPDELLGPDGVPINGTRQSTFKFRRSGPPPRVVEPGLYTLSTIATERCWGTVEEPTTFQVVNPPEPNVEVNSEPIHDTCAGRNIGLRVSLDFSGTPPFTIAYTVAKQGRKSQLQHLTKTFDGPRGQIELRPNDAGVYVYEFTELSDNVYSGQSLRKRKLSLEQDVKPSVHASFVDHTPKQGACLDDRVSYDVRLTGEGPWSLEYELVHGTTRQKERVNDIESASYSIDPPPLKYGGEWSLALLGVTDKQGCRESLTDSVKIYVRHQKPKAGFGLIENKYTVHTLDDKSVGLPVRLSGDGPWTVAWQHTKPGQDTPGPVQTQKFHKNNGVLSVTANGRYDIVSVDDSQCSGAVDPKASRFDVTYVQRPSFRMDPGPQHRLEGKTIIRDAVCEGDDDGVDVGLDGDAPFVIKYQEHIRPLQGSKSLRKQEKTVPMNTAHIHMNTAQAGEYEYAFAELGDNNYDEARHQSTALTIRQTVNPRPSAAFATPGKVYSFCQGEDITAEDSETIPLTLTGQPPFTVELEIKHHGRASRPAPLTVPNIPSNKYSVAIPHRLLQAGSSFVTIRRVRDARGCERPLDPATSPRVQIAVHDSPSIMSLEPERQHYCVGDRISFALSGITPFYVLYTFQGKELKAMSQTPTFRRLAEKPGNFTIVGVQDAGSSCQTRSQIVKEIHQLPSVRVSKGRDSRVDIHAGGSAEITFDFGGTPPFEFVFQRSENAKRGRPAAEHGAVLETRYLESSETQLKITASEEGTYEVVALRDRYCAYAARGHEGELGKFRGNSDRLLGYY